MHLSLYNALNPVQFSGGASYKDSYKTAQYIATLYIALDSVEHSCFFQGNVLRSSQNNALNSVQSSVEHSSFSP